MASKLYVFSFDDLQNLSKDGQTVWVHASHASALGGPILSVWASYASSNNINLQIECDSVPLAFSLKRNGVTNISLLPLDLLTTPQDPAFF